jgi:hypothetical protein
MSLLPGQILPYDVPIGQADEDGKVTVSHDWWLFWYNVSLQVLGVNGSGLPSSAIQELASLDTDALGADAAGLRRPLSNLEVRVHDLTDRVLSASDFPDLYRGLLLAQDALLPDPQPRAQPVQVVTVGASPFSYTAAFDGTVIVTGGTVSAISVIRQGTSVATGITTGLFPLSRLDILPVTYSGLPVMTFLPR